VSSMGVLTTLSSIFLQMTISDLGFDSAFDTTSFNYGVFSMFARNAHCSGKFLQHIVQQRSADLDTPCGLPCAQMFQYLGGSTPTIRYHYNEVDHTQYMWVTSNATYFLAKDAEGESIMGDSVFAFRGTVGHDVLNMRRNFFFKFAPTTLCAECSVHQGFWRNFLALRPTLALDMETASSSVLVGMSMGAPLATLGAAMSLSTYPLGCVTFGMPRVANAAFANFVLRSVTGSVGTIGFAYARDPVPHVPPRFFGFKSTQAKLFHIGLDELFRRTTYERYVAQSEPTEIGEHVMVKYVYTNEPNSFAGDKHFAGATLTLEINDHFAYFQWSGVHGCGFDNDDMFLKQKTAAELFFL